MAAEWISPGLSEQRITKSATFKIPAAEMKAHIIHKEFKTAVDPTEHFAYAQLPELGSNDLLLPSSVQTIKKATPVQGGLFLGKIYTTCPAL